MSDTSIYTSEFTMPDGSTRRPLTERIGFKLPHGYYFCQNNQRADWIMRGSKETGGTAIGVEAGVALMWRAVENWLIGEGFHSFEWSHNSETDTISLELYDYQGVGESMEGALVAAAHAVADGQGVER